MGPAFRLAARSLRQPAHGPLAPLPHPSDPVTRWQRRAGNAAVGLLINRLRLLPKLTVNRPGDRYEQEADRVANQVMRRPDPHGVAPGPVIGSRGLTALQRCGCGGEGGGGGEPCAACRQRETEGQDGGGSSLHRSEAGPAPVDTAPPIVHDVLRSPGKPLDGATRSFMEPRFGRDLGDVRIHTGAQAATSARAVHARAYTVGRDVVFAAGRYQPETEGGRWLLAHELAHVVQQAGPAPALRRYDESTEPNTALGQGALDVVSILGPAEMAIRAIHAYVCLRPLEEPMVDLTFNRWIPAVCARERTSILRNRTWDSFGHCWIGCEASRRCGRGAAAVVGTGREFTREAQRVLGIRPHDSFRQDLANQRKGRALSFVAGTCYHLCDDAYRTGGLDLSAPEGTCIDCAAQVEGPCPP